MQKENQSNQNQESEKSPNRVEGAKKAGEHRDSEEQRHSAAKGGSQAQSDSDSTRKSGKDSSYGE